MSELCRNFQSRNSIAPIAAQRLTSKLKNQREFTQMAYLDGENAGGLAKADGIDGREMFVFSKA